MRTLVIILVALLAMVMLGTAGLQAEARRGGAEAKTPAAKLSDDVDGAMRMIEVAQKLLADDKKKEAMDVLGDAVKALARIKASVSQPAGAPQPGAVAAGGGEAFTGTVESTNSQKRPRLVVGATHYELKPSDKADASVKQTLAKISSSEATGQYTVRGAASGTTLMVDSISKQ